MSSKDVWDGSLFDTPEQIQKCLNCARASCSNCVEHKPRKEAIPKEFLDLYVESPTDKVIAEALHRVVATIEKYRYTYGLPAPRGMTREEKIREVERVKRSEV